MALPIPYSRELGEKICRLIENGSSLSDIGEMDYMPSKQRILRWSVDKTIPEFGENYATAYRVRILTQIEERDDLALKVIQADSPDEVARRYGIDVADDKLLALYIRSDLQSRQVDRKTRIDHLGKSIGQLLQVFDPRFNQKRSFDESIGNFEIKEYAHDQKPKTIRTKPTIYTVGTNAQTGK